MPRYEYRCPACEVKSVISHSAGETPEMCPSCACSDTLVRIYSFEVRQKKAATESAGSRVKSFIEEAKEEIATEKKRIRKKDA